MLFPAIRSRCPLLISNAAPEFFGTSWLLIRFIHSPSARNRSHKVHSEPQAKNLTLTKGLKARSFGLASGCDGVYRDSTKATDGRWWYPSAFFENTPAKQPYSFIPTRRGQIEGPFSKARCRMSQRGKDFSHSVEMTT